MKSFDSPKFYSQLFGVRRWETRYSSTIMTTQNILFLILYVHFLIGSFCALVFIPDSYVQIIRKLFFCGSSIMDIWAYCVLLVNRDAINDILRDTDNFIDDSKYDIHSQFVSLNQPQSWTLIKSKGIRASPFKRYYSIVDGNCNRWLYRSAKYYVILCNFSFVVPNVTE